MTVNVVKVGGSLSQNPKALRSLCQKLSFLADKHCIVVVPGGGKFADCVRAADREFTLSAKTAHHMAILGMDQYGLLLSNLIKPNSHVVNSLEKTKKAKTGIATVFLPSKFIISKDEKELPKSWEVTSDSIAAYIAKKLGAKKVLLLKTVDGIYTDKPKKETQTSTTAKLLGHLTIEELLERENRTCVDPYLPKLLKTLKIDCNIINGLYPDRVETALNKQKVIGTVISP
ncbi:MAG: delta 1-pyrroline-5-carboxylate synthetase [Nitrososphaerota archaeon]|uniref:amino acid kinase family protein n=1 Tax=Candidatus Bathycorpusculum sp. TaxID=2994959 RepID=UPI002835D504|nr:delta 1-pyrroline-5-carboxylate synthetase [Nitrososphaerota archaeon]